MIRQECSVCSEPSSLFGVGRCNHNSICAACHYVMRTKDQNITCALCKEQNEDLIITSDQSRVFESFDKLALTPYQEGLGSIYVPSAEEKASLDLIVIPTCPYQDCEYASKRFLTELLYKKHLKERHRRFLW